MLFLRKIIFYVLLLLYLILCPIIILYALGYVFKPELETPIVETGDISLATLPAGASIYLNGELRKEATPAVLSELVPGNYDIKLELKDYEPWNAALSVEKGKAVVLEKILLVPDEWEGEVLVSGPFQDMIPLLGTEFFIAASGPALKDHIVCDRNKDDSYPIVPPDSPYAELKVSDRIIVKKSAFLLFMASSQAGERYLWIDLGNVPPTVKDVTELFPQKPEWLVWDPSEGTNLFLFEKGAVTRLDITTGALYPGYITGARGLGVEDKTLYILKDDILYWTDYEKKSENPILDDPELVKSIFGVSENYRIMPFIRDILLFTGENGELLANHLPYRFIDRGVIGVKFDVKGGRVLAWTGNEIWTLDFSGEMTGNVPFEKGPELRRVYEKGKNIEQAFWVYEASHVIFRDGNEVFLLGLGEYDAPRIDRLFEVKKESAVFYSEQSGSVYYIDLNGDLASVEITPRGGAAED